MRRKDREITDVNEILDVLNRCDTVRLGLNNGDIPYIVPVSFGLDLDKAVIYFHSASKGLKVDCICSNKDVCIEADIFYKVENCQAGITARYESVMGLGTISAVDETEKVFGLTKILQHYGRPDYPLNDCAALANTNVYKIVLHSLTGKRNLPN